MQLAAVKPGPVIVDVDLHVDVDVDVDEPAVPMPHVRFRTAATRAPRCTRFVNLGPGFEYTTRRR